MLVNDTEMDSADLETLSRLVSKWCQGSADVYAAKMIESLGVTSLKCFCELEPADLVAYSGMKIYQARALHRSVCELFSSDAELPVEGNTAPSEELPASAALV